MRLCEPASETVPFAAGLTISGELGSQAKREAQLAASRRHSHASQNAY